MDDKWVKVDLVIEWMSIVSWFKFEIVFNVNDGNF